MSAWPPCPTRAEAWIETGALAAQEIRGHVPPLSSSPGCGCATSLAARSLLGSASALAPCRGARAGSPSILVEVVLGDVGPAHRLALGPAVADEEARFALHQVAEAVRPKGCPGETPVDGDERRARRERREERRVAGDGAAHDRAEHDAEDHVERGRMAHEALLR